MINLHIAVLGWLVELSGFLFIILGSFILGHGNVTITLTLQTFTMFMMFNERGNPIMINLIYHCTIVYFTFIIP